MATLHHTSVTVHIRSTYVCVCGCCTWLYVFGWCWCGRKSLWKIQRQFLWKIAKKMFWKIFILFQNKQSWSLLLPLLTSFQVKILVLFQFCEITNFYWKWRTYFPATTCFHSLCSSCQMCYLLTKNYYVMEAVSDF